MKNLTWRHINVGINKTLWFQFHWNLNVPIREIALGLLWPLQAYLRFELTKNKNLEVGMRLGSLFCETRVFVERPNENRHVIPVARWFRDAELNNFVLRGLPKP